MDSTSVLLYQCLQTVGTRQVDWKYVGQALGLNANAARMRYTRFEAKMKSKGIAKPRHANKPAINKSRIMLKSKGRTPGAKKNPKPEDSGIESDCTMASAEDETEPNGQEEVKSEHTQATFKRQTRGVKLDFKEESDTSSDHDSESSDDCYVATADKDDSMDENFSDVETVSKSQKPVKSGGLTRHFTRSGSPPMTPGRIVCSLNPKMPPMTPPSSQDTVVESANGKAVLEITSRDDIRIKRELLALTRGMKLSPSTPAKNLATVTAPYTTNSDHIDDSVIHESIEHDDEEEQNSTNTLEKRFDNGSEDDDEDEGEVDQYDTPEMTMASPPLPTADSKTKCLGGIGCAQQ